MRAPALAGLAQWGEIGAYGSKLDGARGTKNEPTSYGDPMGAIGGTRRAWPLGVLNHPLRREQLSPRPRPDDGRGSCPAQSRPRDAADQSLHAVTDGWRVMTAGLPASCVTLAYPATRESANRTDITITIISCGKGQSVGEQTAHWASLDETIALGMILR